MGFQVLDIVPSWKDGRHETPDKGVRVGIRGIPRKSAPNAKYIAITIGAALARAIELRGAKCNLSLMFGDGENRGHLLILNDPNGKASAKKMSNGCYLLTLNTATIDGLFSTNFQTFTRDSLDPKVTQGMQSFSFLTSDEMLFNERADHD